MTANSTDRAVSQRIYINLLVTTATVHRAMQGDSAFGQSSALVHREQDLSTFRVRALQEVNHRLAKKDTQTSDSTLMCVICLLLSTVGVILRIPDEPTWELMYDN